MEDSTDNSEVIQYQSGDTITISLEDASQLMQGIEGGVLPPGTYQILTQEGYQLGDGSLDASVGFTVVQSIPEGMTDLSEGHIVSGLEYINPTNNGQDRSFSLSEQQGAERGSPLGELQEKEDVQSTELHVGQIESQTESALDLNQNNSEENTDIMEERETQENEIKTDQKKADQDQEIGIRQSDDLNKKSDDVREHDTVQAGESNKAKIQPMDDQNTKVKEVSKFISLATLATPTKADSVQIGEENPSISLSSSTASPKVSQQEPNEIHAEVIVIPPIKPPTAGVAPKVETPKSARKKVDLSQPITVTQETEIMVNGKKCILRPNPSTGQLCAYPVLPPDGKKRRGRPPKGFLGESPGIQSSPGKRLDPVLKEKSKEQTNAAEGLLELSNTGPDGIRRSGRTRKKAKTLDDYEVTEVSSDDDGTKQDNEDGDDDDATKVIPSLRRKIKLEVENKDVINVTPFITPTNPAKRGRGRPRRYPPPGQSNTSTQIPAVIIPGANGQTLMMAPIQGLSNFQAFQQQMKKLPEIITKSPVVSTITINPTSAVTSVMSTETVTATSAITMATSDNLTSDLPDIESDAITTQSSDVTMETITTDASVECINITQGESEDPNNDLEEAASSAECLMVKAEMASPLKSAEGTSGNDENDKSLSDQERTIIQIPQNLLPMFLPKNNPVKLGLKFSEKELDDLKCRKCGYQAFYPQQYQNHISSHVDETQKCKCCSFVSFDKEGLIQHFKESHPRCICPECDFMAEYAYVIKRHMMRHTAIGCTCDICGKTYKDQYILKMHVKMVHMPAEVLFECTVCSKKFTRKAHLKRHLRIHEPEKPYKCPHCDYRGCERSDISKHILIHEEPRHVCEVCGKAFRHMKNKFLHLKRHSGQRDYKCGVCDFFGYTFTDIRKHIERKHSEIKTLFCDKCGAAFKSEAILREHQKQQCEMFMIEQALSIATSTGSTSHATIQIPSSTLTMDSRQLLTSLNNGSVNIQVEHIPDDDEEIAITEEELTEAELSEEHIQESFQNGNLTIADAQVIESVVSESHGMDGVTHGVIDSHGNIEVAFEGTVAEAEVIESVSDNNAIETVSSEGVSIEETVVHEDVDSMMEGVSGEEPGTSFTDTDDNRLVMEMSS